MKTSFPQEVFRMLTLPAELLPLIVEFQPLFSKSVWQNAQTLLVGAILAIGQRTVTACLRVTGKSADTHFQNYHRVLNRAQKIKAKGLYRDPVRASHSHFVKASGLRWLSCMWLQTVPWAAAVWGGALSDRLVSIRTLLRGAGASASKLTARAWQMIALVARWLPERVLVFVTDSSFAVFVLLDQVRRLENVSLITRLRLDAQLYDRAPERQPGRPRLKGARRPSPQQRLADRQTKWAKVKVKDWYGGGERQIEAYRETCLWGTTGKPYVPIRWVLVRAVLGAFAPCALLSTALTHQPIQMLT